MSPDDDVSARRSVAGQGDDEMANHLYPSAYRANIGRMNGRGCGFSCRPRRRNSSWCCASSALRSTPERRFPGRPRALAGCPRKLQCNSACNFGRRSGVKIERRLTARPCSRRPIASRGWFGLEFRFPAELHRRAIVAMPIAQVHCRYSHVPRGLIDAHTRPSTSIARSTLRGRTMSSLVLKIFDRQERMAPRLSHACPIAPRGRHSRQLAKSRARQRPGLTHRWRLSLVGASEQGFGQTARFELYSGRPATLYSSLG